MVEAVKYKEICEKTGHFLKILSLGSKIYRRDPFMRYTALEFFEEPYL
jgi:hypothetical protein